MNNKMTPEKTSTQNRSSSNAKKEKSLSNQIFNGENESSSQLDNESNISQPIKSRTKQTKSQTIMDNSDKNTSLNQLSFVPAKLSVSNKIVQPFTHQELDKMLNQQNNDKMIFSEKNKNSLNKISNEFRQGTKPKQGNSKVLEHRGSLKGPQSIELFQKEHLTGLNNQSPNKSKFAVQQSNANVNSIIIKNENGNKENNIEENEYYEDNENLSPKKKIIRQSFGLSQAGKYEKDVAKENQDSFFVLNNVLGLEDFNIYGVMDGHGTNGHFVSYYIKQNAVDYFTKEETYRNPKKSKKILSSALIYDKIVANENGIVKAFFKKVSDELINEKFDVHYSGSTCVIVFHIGNKIICANVGDSRAIAIKDIRSTVESPSSDPFAYFEIVPLSQDHKPELPLEKYRIEKMGGIVERSIEKDGSQDGPYRVFLKGQKVPGIAMSRSLGDEIAESIGVVHSPEVIITEVTNNFKYLALASDGVWEFFPNEKVMSIINLHFFRNDIKSACEAVIAEATSWWKKEDSIIDDITIVIAFLGNIHIKKCTI